MVSLVSLATAACGGDPLPAAGPARSRTATAGAASKPAAPGKGEAARRARAEHRTAEPDDVPSKGKKWGGWKYQGPADDCFYLVKRKCFTALDDACDAARCGKKTCVPEGAGPASVRCE